MATPNRAALIKKVLRGVRKHFESYTPPKNRTLLEHLLFACLLENSSHDAAERAFATLDKEYFDLNEVRVSTARELSESFRGLVDPLQAADRLRRSLQSVFESVYAFDLEGLKKQNIGQAVKTLEKYDGSTPFVVAFVTQNALGGHAIPVNCGLLLAFQVLGVVSEVEAESGVVPGLERAIPKSKGVEAASLLHQLGVEVGRNPYGTAARKLLLEIDPTCKSRLPKRPVKKDELPEEPPEEPETTKEKAKTQPPAKKAKPAAKTAKKAASGASKKPSAAKRKIVKKKKTAQKKTKKKKTKTKKKTSSRRLARKKPR